MQTGLNVFIRKAPPIALTTAGDNGIGTNISNAVAIQQSACHRRHTAHRCCSRSIEVPDARYISDEVICR